MAMRCMASPGDHVIAPFPAYQSLYANLASIGCHVDKWEPELVQEELIGRDEDAAKHAFQWRFSLASLKRLVKPKTKLIVVNFPHNPTGALIDPEEWLELLEFCRRKSIAIFSDEMYKYLETSDDNIGTPYTTLPPACTVLETATSLFGVSKSLSLPGLRIGWLVTRDGEVMKKLKSFKDYLSICSSAPSEVLSLIAVRYGWSAKGRAVGLEKVKIVS